MFTQEYFKLGYNLQKQAGLFDSKEVAALKRKERLKEVSEFMDKAIREKDINHDWRSEKVMAGLLGAGALGLGAAGLAGADPTVIANMAKGGLLGLGAGYGAGKLMNYAYDNVLDDNTKRKHKEFQLAGIKNLPDWLV